MVGRPEGGAPTGAPEPGGRTALQTPRRKRGSGPPPRLPRGGASIKESKRRRPDARARRHAHRLAAKDDAACAAPPYATMLRALGAWTALGVAYWVLRTIQFGFRVPWVRRPPPTRSKGYAMPDSEREWCMEEVGRWVEVGYVTRLSQAAGAGSPWVSPSYVLYGGKPALVIDLRKINTYTSRRLFHYQRLGRRWPRCASASWRLGPTC